MKGFKKGDRVKISELGKLRGQGATKQKPHGDYGTVMTDQKDHYVRIRQDGFKTAFTYLEDYWDLSKK